MSEQAKRAEGSSHFTILYMSNASEQILLLRAMPSAQDDTKLGVLLFCPKTTAVQTAKRTAREKTLAFARCSLKIGVDNSRNLCYYLMAE